MAIFAIGSLWFWLFVAAAASFIIWILEDYDSHSGIISSIVVLAVFVILYLFGGKAGVVGLLSFISDNPLLCLAVFAGYLLLGSIWSIIKWYFFVLNARDEYRDHIISITRTHENFVKENRSRIAAIEKEPSKHKDPDQAIALMKERIAESERVYVHDIEYQRGRMMPQAKENRGRIITWMFYWPFSAVWTVINDPMRRIFTMIYRGMEGVFQKIADRAFKI